MGMSAPTYIPYLPGEKMGDVDWARGYTTNAVYVRREKRPELLAVCIVLCYSALLDKTSSCVENRDMGSRMPH